MNTASEAGRRVLLNRLYRRYAEEKAFSDLQAGDNPLVPGTGSLTPRLMFVGEAPGRLEQKHRVPFIGASGRFLDEMLKSVGLERREVFITNSVKYRPTDGYGRNRPPTDDEVHAGMRWLRKEHDLLGRPPIVMLGKHARRQVEVGYRLPYGLTVGHWSWLGGIDGFPVLPLFHPAYGIYQQSNRPLMFEQFKAVLSPPAYGETP